MIFNIIYFIGIIGFIIYSYFKGTSKVISQLAIATVAILFGLLLSDFVAVLLSKYANFLDLEESMPVILGSEYVYFKTTGFLIVYILATLTLNITVSRFFEDRFEFDSVLAKINLGVFLGVFQMTILLSVALATPYALDYSNKFSSLISNVPGVGTVMNKITYDYNDFNGILEDNPGLNQYEINVVVMEEMIEDNYSIKKRMNKVVESSKWYDDDIKEWLNK